MRGACCIRLSETTEEEDAQGTSPSYELVSPRRVGVGRQNAGPAAERGYAYLVPAQRHADSAECILKTSLRMFCGAVA